MLEVLPYRYILYWTRERRPVKLNLLAIRTEWTQWTSFSASYSHISVVVSSVYVSTTVVTICSIFLICITFCEFLCYSHRDWASYCTVSFGAAPWATTTSCGSVGAKHCYPLWRSSKGTFIVRRKHQVPPHGHDAGTKKQIWNTVTAS